MKIILQSESSECGLACLAMICNHFGMKTDLSELRRKFSISRHGATLSQLIRYAGTLNLSARPLRLELHELEDLQCPCILHWNLGHFVVLKEIKKTFSGIKKVVLLDPALGERVLLTSDISAHFTGVALELTPTSAFEELDTARRISITNLVGKIRGLKRATAQIVAIALALEVFAMLAPLFSQFVIDEVIASGDTELLIVLTIGFSLMLVTQTGISVARSWFLMRWSLDVGFQWANRVFAHMIRLPTQYFERRHLGDIVSRFNSIGAIQSTLTSLFVEGLLDGFMAIFTLGLMIAYSANLTTIILGGVVVYGLLRWIFYGPFRNASMERLILSAKENSNFLETIRAIVPLKLYGKEAERQSRWQNLKQDVVNRDFQTQKLGLMFKTGSGAVFGIQNIALFYTGAVLIMNGKMSVGMLMAFASYANIFSSRVFNLIDLLINIKMLSMHIDRLADIVLEPAEDDPRYEFNVEGIKGEITLKNVKFRYAAGDPYVLDGVNLHIPAGQSIAVVGPSGCGKTTLCKIIVGLIEPTEGEVLIDGQEIKKIGLQTYRQLFGTVMQEDVLLAGSIRENITFFDSTSDIERVKNCARTASVNREIETMPMAYNTLVGDLGSSLSGGQKQRILLARALYKAPKVLALDEATSHLDVSNERLVNAALNALAVTRIIVAHRPETINSAERVVKLELGKIISDEEKNNIDVYA